MQPTLSNSILTPLSVATVTTRALASRFKHAAIWAVAGAVASRALNMAAWLMCARILGKVAFGRLTIVQSTTGALGLLSGMGLGLTATKYIAELRESHPERAGRILGLGQAIALVAGSVMAIGLVLGAPTLAAKTLGEPGLSTPLAIGAGLVFFGSLNGFQTGALVGLEAFRTLARVGFWTGLVSLPCIVIGTWFFGVNGAVSGFVLALAASAIGNQMALRRECLRARVPFTTRGCLTELPILLHFSLPALLASAFVSPAMWLCDTWLIHQRDGFAQLGLYGAADRWRLAILFIPASMTGPVLSMLASLKGAGDHAGYRTIFRLNMLVTVGSVAVLALIAAPLASKLMRLFGGAYQDGSLVLSVLAFSAIAEASNTFLGQRVVTRSMWTRFWFDAVLVATLLTSAFFFIPRWRSVGLAFAYGLAFLIASLCLVVYDWSKGRSL